MLTGLGVVVLRPEHLHLHEGAEEAAAALAAAQVPRPQDPDAEVDGGRRRKRRRVPAASREISDFLLGGLRQFLQGGESRF